MIPRRPSRPRFGGAILPPSRLRNEELLDMVRLAIVPANRPGARGVRLGTHPPNPAVDETVIFAGLLPPFSAFFFTILESYGIHLLHLSPNSIVILVAFAHLCEMFVGVMP